MNTTTSSPPFFVSEVNMIIIAAIIMVLFISATVFVMIRDYRLYLEENWREEFSFSDFLKREQLYIYTLLFFLFLIGGELLVLHYTNT